LNCNNRSRSSLPYKSTVEELRSVSAIGSSP
jgi:hypothetical protein